MSRNLPRPFFPIPPKAYNQQYMAAIIEAFALYVQQKQNPGAARATGIVLTNLQANDQGLEVGEVFQVDGVLRVSQVHSAYLAGAAGTGSVGTVTVTTA